MKIVASLSLVLSLLLAASTAAGIDLFSPGDMRYHAAQVVENVDALDFENWDEADLNAYFAEPGTYCMDPFCMFEPLVIEKPTLIFAGNWSDWPVEARLLVLYHELGHYRQYVEGRPGDEWDADVYAANLFCRRGLDGIHWMEYVLGRTSDGDWSWGQGSTHGSHLQRLENVRAKSTCGSTRQAP